jgi:hypothetical protein
MDTNISQSYRSWILGGGGGGGGGACGDHSDRLGSGTQKSLGALGFLCCPPYVILYLQIFPNSH